MEKPFTTELRWDDEIVQQAWLTKQHEHFLDFLDEQDTYRWAEELRLQGKPPTYREMGEEFKRRRELRRNR